MSYIMTDRDVTRPDDESGTTAGELARIHDRLYEKLGQGAISKAADKIGVHRARISNVLSPSSREIVAELEELVSRD
jgi:hypothetical protein